MAELFQKDRTVLGRHINNIFKEGELEESLVCAKFAHTRIMVVEKGLPSGRKPVCMEELFNILSEGKVHVRVEMDAADLKAFSDELIRRAKDELGSMVEAARKERMLSKAEVKELFGVCDATLWHWDRKGILKPVKTGNKVLYPEHEVRKALGQRNQIL